LVSPGEGTIRIEVNMPDGYKLNDLAPFTAIWPDDPVAQVAPDARDYRVVLPDLPVEIPVTFAEGQTELARSDDLLVRSHQRNALLRRPVAAGPAADRRPHRRYRCRGLSARSGAAHDREHAR